MKIVVTGAKGFVGSRLAAALKSAGHDVYGLDVGDSADGLSAVAPVDVFYHLAWQGARGPARADYALQLENVRMSLDYHALACRLGAKRFVCAGTIGELMAESPECAGIRSQNFVYVNAKGFLRRLLAIRETSDCKVVWARLGNLYGGDLHGNLVDYTVARLSKGERAEFGPAEQPYDFVHVDDAIRGLVLIGTSAAKAEDAYYVGSGRSDVLADWLREIGRVAGKSELVAIGARPDDGTRYRREWFSIAPLAALGYEPRVMFADGVRQVWNEVVK